MFVVENLENKKNEKKKTFICVTELLIYQNEDEVRG